MDLFSVLNLIGGLALFLFGMNTMGEGLVKASGGKLESILYRLTSNKFKSLLTGCLVTAVIQSSSATTVMVVGFVNSGMMKLQQAVGIIMGANIGTTITSWILSLTGIQSSNVFIKILKPSSFSPVLAAIGIILLMMSKDEKKKDIGTIMIGFAVLMFGMETMSSAVAPLKDDPNFCHLMVTFSNPIIGVMIGAGVTAIIQSSSASVGILQALCSTGVVGYTVAIPIIMGQNIGTCITAIISSIGESTNAKRASMIHLYFNLIGTILFLIVFYTLNSFMHFSFLHLNASITGIAIIHSLFNIGCCIVLFPFSNLLVKLASLTIKDKNIIEDTLDPVLTALDDRFITHSSYALELSMHAVSKMADLCLEIYNMTMLCMNGYSDQLNKDINKLEDEIDIFENKIGNYLMKISSKDMSDHDSQLLSILLYSISDLERISDHSCIISNKLKVLNHSNMNMSEEAKNELTDLLFATEHLLKKTVNSLKTLNKEDAKEIIILRSDIQSLSYSTKERHIQRLRNKHCSLETGILLEDMIASTERIVSHCSGISKCILKD